MGGKRKVLRAVEGGRGGHRGKKIRGGRLSERRIWGVRETKKAGVNGRGGKMGGKLRGRREDKIYVFCFSFPFFSLHRKKKEGLLKQLRRVPSFLAR